jgi:hypothetical protein
MAANFALLSPAGQTGTADEVKLSIGFTTTTSGAISAGTAVPSGILTASRTAAGEYTCTVSPLQLIDIRDLIATIKSGAVVAGKAYDAYISSDLSSGTFKVQFCTGGGVAADVADGAKVNITVFGKSKLA